MSHQHKGWLAIPASIVIAGFLIALSIYMGAMEISGSNSISLTKSGNIAPSTGESAKPRAASSRDHILGNPAAKVTIIEYSDTECPYCKAFHSTMHKVIDTYSKDGSVAWVYRHFPLPSHPLAKKEAEATECAAELGGNTMFWKYTDMLYEITPSNNKLDPKELGNIAEKVGLNRSAFQTCLDSGKYAAKIEADIKDGTAAGVRGTPHSFILYGDQMIPLKGAASYETIEQSIKKALGK